MKQKQKQKKGRWMSEAAFAELMESLEQALQYERGERQGLRVTVIAAPGGRRRPQETSPSSSATRKTSR